MKKLFVGMICLFSISQLSFANEVVTRSSGEEVVLFQDGTWRTKERQDRIDEFKQKVDIEIVKINKKSSQYRTLTFKVTNNTREDLAYVVFGVKFKFGEEYSLRKIVSVNNVPNRESIEMQRQISVQDIEGQDAIIEIIDFGF